MSIGLYIGNAMDSCNCGLFTKAIAMLQTDGETEPGSFPVEVFDVDKVSIGFAFNKTDYISIWNALPKHSPIGFLTGAAGPFVFQFNKNNGPVPSFVFGNATNISSNQYPSIVLIGSNPYVMYVGDTYTEPGFSASDTEDGDITSHVVITNNLDRTTVGSYQYAYNVTDAGGLHATQRTRTISVIDIPCVVFTAAQTAPGEITVSFVRSAIATGGYVLYIFDVDNNQIGTVNIDMTGIAVGGTKTLVYNSGTGDIWNEGETYRFLVSQKRAVGYASPSSCAKQSVTMSSSSSTLTATLKYRSVYTPGDFTGGTTLRTQTFTPGGTLTISLAGLPDEKNWWVEYSNSDPYFQLWSIGLTVDQPIPDASFDEATVGSTKYFFVKGTLSVDTSQNLILKH